MSTFLSIAEPLIKMGIPMTPILPGTKRAFLEGFQKSATTNLDQIKTWDAQFPNHNAACVARAEEGGVWFWEVDSPDVLSRIQKDTGHDVLTEVQTFKVRSRPGRGHFYFRHTKNTLDLPNLSQTYVVGQDWSLRTDREYVVAPGSVHPDTGRTYDALNWNIPIATAPQWLVDWLLSQKIQKLSAPQGIDAPRNAQGRVPHGAIHGYMLREAGRLRQQGLSEGVIREALRELVENNCEPPIDWDKVDTMAKSICNFPPGENKALLFTQQPEVAVPAAPPEPEEEIDYSSAEYPVFPKWVMNGTSIYEGFVKPYCEKNSRIDYFMWMPTAALMMNYLGTKVKVPFKSWKPSFYLVLIGEKGRAHKSSSVKDGMRFLEIAGVLSMYSRDIKNADGKTLVWEAGSPEGLGTDMQRTNCKNATLFYDELSVLLSKSQIDGSGIGGALLKLYESNQFANSIKSKRDAFSVAPDTYVASLITCTTTQRFHNQWSQFSHADSGLDERFTFVLQPEEMPVEELESTVSYHKAALETRKLIDRAVNKGEYQFFDQTPFKEAMRLYGGRPEIRAEKWALYFAIDLGLDEIDEDCVERGIAMARYEHEVRQFLKTFEAVTDESRLQQEVILWLKKHRGILEKRVLERRVHAERYGTTMWRKAFYGLVTDGYIVESGAGQRGSPRLVHMIRDMKIGEE